MPMTATARKSSKRPMHNGSRLLLDDRTWKVRRHGASERE